MNDKRRSFLKAKRKGLIPAAAVIPQTKTISVSNECKKVLYSSVSGKDKSIFSHFKLPLLQKEPMQFVAMPSTEICSSFLPPSNLKFLTQKPLIPLEIEDLEQTKPVNFFTVQWNKCFIDTAEQGGKKTDLSENYEVHDDVVVVSESPPPSFQNCTSNNDYLVEDATASSVPQIGENPSERSRQEHIIDSSLIEDETDQLLADVDLDEFDEASFDKDLDEFDKLCREIDMHASVNSSAAMRCSICGIDLEQGMTMEAHTEMCCPMDEIILIDD